PVPSQRDRACSSFAATPLIAAWKPRHPRKRCVSGRRRRAREGIALRGWGSVAGTTGRAFEERKSIMVIRSHGSKRGLRAALLFALGVALQACVAARPAPAPVVDLKARSDEAQAACRAKPLVNYVARAKCLNDAAMIAAPTVENPDLFRRALNARI